MTITLASLSLRYLGQYFDQEDGLAYNLFRDYESGTGRYVESDPIRSDRIEWWCEYL